MIATVVVSAPSKVFPKTATSGSLKFMLPFSPSTSGKKKKGERGNGGGQIGNPRSEHVHGPQEKPSQQFPLQESFFFYSWRSMKRILSIKCWKKKYIGEVSTFHIE